MLAWKAMKVVHDIGVLKFYYEPSALKLVARTYEQILKNRSLYHIGSQWLWLATNQVIPQIDTDLDLILRVFKDMVACAIVLYPQIGVSRSPIWAKVANEPIDHKWTTVIDAVRAYHTSPRVAIEEVTLALRGKLGAVDNTIEQFLMRVQCLENGQDMPENLRNLYNPQANLQG